MVHIWRVSALILQVLLTWPSILCMLDMNVIFIIVATTKMLNSVVPLFHVFFMRYIHLGLSKESVLFPAVPPCDECVTSVVNLSVDISMVCEE